MEDDEPTVPKDKSIESDESLGIKIYDSDTTPKKKDRRKK